MAHLARNVINHYVRRKPDFAPLAALVSTMSLLLRYRCYSGSQTFSGNNKMKAPTLIQSQGFLHFRVSRWTIKDKLR